MRLKAQVRLHLSEEGPGMPVEVVLLDVEADIDRRATEEQLESIATSYALQTLAQNWNLSSGSTIQVAEVALQN